MATVEDYEFPLTDADRQVLAQTDEEYRLHDWAQLQSIIENNELASLKRKPSDLRRYIKWTAETRAAYGSVTNFLVAHRLPQAWGTPPYAPASTTPFADPSDYRVLLNDWPYGLASGITHIVVWTRTLIPTDAHTGDMTAESRTLVEDFVRRFFVEAMAAQGDDRVLWFKNWTQLQSVRTLEHFHVLVRDASPELLQEWTAELPCHLETDTMDAKK